MFLRPKHRAQWREFEKSLTGLEGLLVNARTMVYLLKPLLTDVIELYTKLLDAHKTLEVGTPSVPEGVPVVYKAPPAPQEVAWDDEGFDGIVLPPSDTGEV